MKKTVCDRCGNDGATYVSLGLSVCNTDNEPMSVLPSFDSDLCPACRRRLEAEFARLVVFAREKPQRERIEHERDSATQA